MGRAEDLVEGDRCARPALTRQPRQPASTWWLAYDDTHGLDTVITRGANTTGPRQYPEKLIPLFVTNALYDVPLPMYGDGMQRRDWLFVDDHADGIGTALGSRRARCRLLQRLGRRASSGPTAR